MSDAINSPTPEDDPPADAWDQLPKESRQAYAAFCAYYLMPPRIRSIDAAYRQAQYEKALDKWRQDTREAEARNDPILPPQPQKPGFELKANGNWRIWCSKFDWVSRAGAWDEYAIHLEQEIWLDRREELRQQNWDQAMTLRAIIDDALVVARDFTRQTVNHFPATDEQPARTVVTIQFDITGLARVMETASKLQQQATNDPSTIVELRGGVLDKQIESELARLLNPGETGDAFPFAGDESAAE